ncbi:MAG: thioredoxin family protein [Acidobacteria bacterium]|nr:thioredoxin family protein [Acidobacteriota bacterium]
MIPLVLAAATGAIGLIGWFWWRGEGRLTRGSGERIRPREVALPDDAFGLVGTMLLFGSRQDERTDLARVRLEGMIDGIRGVALAEVDLTARGDLAGRYGITRTPSLFALDGQGRLRARVKGAADAETLRAALDSVLRPPD